METGAIGTRITFPTPLFAATLFSTSGTATTITPAAVACITDGGAPAPLATSRRSRKPHATPRSRPVRRIILEASDDCPEEAEGELLICRVIVGAPERPIEELMMQTYLKVIAVAGLIGVGMLSLPSPAKAGWGVWMGMRVGPGLVGFRIGAIFVSHVAVYGASARPLPGAVR